MTDFEDSDASLFRLVMHRSALILTALALAIIAVTSSPAAGATLSGTATVSDVSELAGIPGFLSATPILGDTVTFEITYSSAAFGPDVNGDPTAGSYVYSGVSSYVIDFGVKGVFTSELFSVIIASDLNTDPLIDGWAAFSGDVDEGGEQWRADIGFIEDSVDLFADDSLRTIFDADAFLADSFPDTIEFEDSSELSTFQLTIDSAVSVPEPAPAALLALAVWIVFASRDARTRLSARESRSGSRRNP